MKQICTIWMQRGTITDTKKTLKRYGIDKEDIDITREFAVDGFRGKLAIFVTEKEIFDRIVEDTGLCRYNMTQVEEL